MGRLSRIAVIALAGLLVAGCAAFQEYVDIARSHTLSKQYQASLDEWTRERTVYSEFSTLAKMVATLKGPEFMEAWQAEYGRVYLVDQSPEAELPLSAAETSPEVAEFFLYVYVPERESIDLSEPDSAWRVVLFDAKGNRYEPREIRELRDPGPLVTEFYPYANPYYGKIYLVKFDGAALGKDPTELPVTLVVTGVIARAELTW